MSTKIRRRVSRRARALLDTSVVVDLDVLHEDQLPDECSIATITLAELSAGLHAVTDSAARAARQEVLQYVESAFQSVPFDSEAARAYGRIYAAVRAAGQKPRGGRAVDFFIAATALSRGLPLLTRNSADFTTVANLVEIVSV
jgi:predicted nucleic acid-binding protein